MLGAAAVARTIAWAAHDAGFATVFIGVEVVAGGFFAFAATRLDAKA